MQTVGTFNARCPICRSYNLEARLERSFYGVVISCRSCAFDDYIENPFGDARILLDMPKSWCLVYNECRSIR